MTQAPRADVMAAPPAAEQEQAAGPGLWAALAQAVEERRPPTADLWATLAERLDFSRKKPRRAADVEVAHQTRTGGEYYILRNRRANTYLKIEPQDYFLWQRFDGEHSVRDLAVAYFAQYRAFPFDRLVHLLAQLKAKHFLDEKPLHVLGGVAHRLAARTLAYRLQHFTETSTQKELSLKNVDATFGWLYRHVAWPFFTQPARAAFILLAVAGLVLFGQMLATRTYPLARVAGSYGLGLLVLVLGRYIIILFHECGHALTCKHYGRSVFKGGVLFYYGSPAFFVDTTDIWMAPKAARLATSFGGPAVDLVTGGLLVVLITLFPASPLSPALFQLAFVAYLGVLMNLAPMMELDGYFILMDWLEIPMLRRKSLAFVRTRLLDKLFRRRSSFTREEKIFAVYGSLSGAWTAFMMVLVVFLWQSQVQVIIRNVIAGRDIVSAILVGGLTVVAGAPLIVGLAIKAILLVGDAVERLRRSGD